MAASTAVKLKQKECTFAPELTARARSVRSRSFRELSIGDAALREAKQVGRRKGFRQTTYQLHLFFETAFTQPTGNSDSRSRNNVLYSEPSANERVSRLYCTSRFFYGWMSRALFPIALIKTKIRRNIMLKNRANALYTSGSARINQPCMSVYTLSKCFIRHFILVPMTVSARWCELKRYK